MVIERISGTEKIARQVFNERNDIKTQHIATVLSLDNAKWIIERFEKHVCDDHGRDLKSMRVIEIGAGLGYFAMALAARCKHVIAIEADPMFSREFAVRLYEEKPKNLTWIFDTASEEMTSWLAYADFVVIITGSDEDRLRKIGQHFCLTDDPWRVVMPWQDWNNGVARIGAGPDFVPGNDHEVSPGSIFEDRWKKRRPHIRSGFIRTSRVTTFIGGG